MAYETYCQGEQACSEPTRDNQHEYSAADARDDQRRPFGGNPCSRPESRLQRSRALTKSQLYGAKLVLAVEIAKGNCEFLNLLLDLGQAILHLHALICRTALLLKDLECRARFVERGAPGAQLQILIGLVVLNNLDLRRVADGTDGRDEGIEAVGWHADSEMESSEAEKSRSAFKLSNAGIFGDPGLDQAAVGIKALAKLCNGGDFSYF